MTSWKVPLPNERVPTIVARWWSPSARREDLGSRGGVVVDQDHGRVVRSGFPTACSRGGPGCGCWSRPRAGPSAGTGSRRAPPRSAGRRRCPAGPGPGPSRPAGRGARPSTQLAVGPLAEGREANVGDLAAAGSLDLARTARDRHRGAFEFDVRPPERRPPELHRRAGRSLDRAVAPAGPRVE